LLQTVCCDINEDLLRPVNGRWFYRAVSPLWYIWALSCAEM